jgi:hypothetical protein
MPVDCPHCAKPVEGWIPEDRLKKATADKREALASAAAAATQLEELTGQAAGAADLQAALETAQAELAQVTASHTSQISVMGHGITDPDDVADLLAIFGRRAPEGVTVGDWLADTANLPRAVSALMSTPAAPATAAAPAPAAEAAPAPVAPVANGTPLPAANTGAVPTPPAQALPSAADLANMTTEQYRANRDRILAGLTKTPPPA